MAGLAAAFGSGAMTNSIAEIESADVILVMGSNTTENHPIISSHIKRAVTKRGARLIVIDPRRIDLVRYASIWLRHRPGTDVAVLNGMMHCIISEGLHAEGYIAERTEGFSLLEETVRRYPPESVQQVAGVPAGELKAAARLYATAARASILYAMGITQHTCGTDNVKSLANLAMLCAKVGIEGGGVNPLRGQNNVQGACDMGALPDFLPGYQPLSRPESVALFQQAWGVPLPAWEGRTLVEIMDGARNGAIRALYVMGENPLVSDPDLSHVDDALRRLDLLVVQDIFLTETARLADVVLPAACFAEKEGTFTNTERRVQRVRRALDPPGEARADWEIISGLSTRLGYTMNYPSPREIMEEISSLVPIYGGITYDRLEKGGLQWPCPDRDHPGTKFLHRYRFTRGLGRFHAVDYRPPAESPDEEYPLLLSTGRVLYHYHTGTMTRLSEGIMERCPGPAVDINPADAGELGVREGQMVSLVSRRGRVRVQARLTGDVPRGMVFMNFHFAEAGANILTNPALDPVGKIPELKVCAVRLEA